MPGSMASICCSPSGRGLEGVVDDLAALGEQGALDQLVAGIDLELACSVGIDQQL